MNKTNTIYSNKKLEIVEGDLSFHNPVYLGPDGGWFWLVDLAFGAWALRVSARARAAGDLSESNVRSLSVIFAHLTAIYGIESVIAIESHSGPTLALSPVLEPLVSYFPDLFRTRHAAPTASLATPDVMARQPPPAPPAPPRRFNSAPTRSGLFA